MNGHVTIELSADRPWYGPYSKPDARSHRPVTLAEWEKIERRARNGRRLRRTSLGTRNAPRPVLADGRFVDDVLNERRRA